MRWTVRTLKGAVAAGLVVSALLIGSVPVDAALKPNYSIFFFRPGQTVTGTLHNGLFAQKKSFSTSGWTAAAASRDTLALYNSKTGKLKTGTFLNGVFTQKSVKTIDTGWTTAAASCDTVLFYKRPSGAAFTATLKGGVMGKRTNYGFSPGWDLIDASCNTATFLANGSSSATGVNGHLKGGKFTQTGGFAVAPYTNLTHTDNSYLLYSSKNLNGIWGPSGGGTEGLSGSASDFSTWDLVAGTADSVLFYRSNGTEARATLKNGVYALVGSGADFSSGWTIIVGGR